MNSILRFAFVALLSLGFVSANCSFAQGCNELFFSEYIEGWGNNKVIEIYNPTGSTIDLGDYRLERYANGETIAEENGKIDLSGAIEANTAMVFTLDKRNAPEGTTGQEANVWDDLLDLTDFWLCPDYNENNAMYFNGNDAMVLRKISSNQVIDVIGQVGNDPGLIDFETGEGDKGWSNMTQNHTLIRKFNITAGDGVGGDEFIVSDEWDGILWSTDEDNYTIDQVFVNLGGHTCECGTTGVEEAVATRFTEMFPNPIVGDVIQLQSSKLMTGLEMRNLAGQLVKSEQMLNGMSHQVTMDGVAPGLYLIQVSHSDGSIVTRRMIRR